MNEQMSEWIRLVGEAAEAALDEERQNLAYDVYQATMLQWYIEIQLTEWFGS